MRPLRLDLHIHSCLSPCGDYGMAPGNVIARAREAGVDVLGITDHNSAGNVRAFQGAGRRGGVAVIGGMEIATREEVHVLAFCDGWQRLAALQTRVQTALDGRNDEEAFGPQIVVDEQDEPLGLEERLLIGATRLSLGEVVEAIHEVGGLAVAAHVDRESFSVISQLGFLPPEVRFDALEVSWRCRDPEPYRGHGLPLVWFSDAHYLHEVGRKVTRALLEEPTVAELQLALVGRDGRRLVS